MMPRVFLDDTPVPNVRSVSFTLRAEPSPFEAQMRAMKRYLDGLKAEIVDHLRYGEVIDVEYEVRDDN